jgi:hypothetical protein
MNDPGHASGGLVGLNTQESQGDSGPVTLAPPGWLRDQRMEAMQDIDQDGDEQKHEADDDRRDCDCKDCPPEDGYHYHDDEKEDEGRILALLGRGKCQHVRSNRLPVPQATVAAYL